MPDQHPPGPIRIPYMPPNVEMARLRSEKLRGHTTAADWLPRGVWAELDDVADEHAARRARLLDVLQVRAALDERYRDEDRQHKRALVQQARDGAADVKDERTPHQQRAEERAAAEERVWAAAEVLAEVADNVDAMVRELEDDWLRDLRQRLKPAGEKRREAVRLLAEAKADEWQIVQLGRWVQQTAEGVGIFSRQPAPVPTAPPKQFTDAQLADALEVSWWKRQDRENLQPWQDSARPKRARDVDPLPQDDQTGVVSDLEIAS